MYFDGSYTSKEAKASIILIPSEGDILKYAIQLEFLATNNVHCRIQGAGHRSSASQRYRHSMTSYQGRLSAGRKASLERV
jgi:hypothetical protein